MPAMPKNKNPLARAEDAPRTPGGNPCGKAHTRLPEACRSCVRVLAALVELRASHRPGKSSRATSSAHLVPQRTHDRRRGMPAGGRDAGE